jgi:23S rRNA pseudouridine955/2504/2580 synthase
MYRSFFYEDDAIARFDRWLKRQFPYLTQGHIEKLLRHKDIILNGKKAEASTRIHPHDTIQIKTYTADQLALLNQAQKREPFLIRSDADNLKKMILWEDNELLVLNKPSGIATQGGTKTTLHIDGLLKAYQHFFEPKTTFRLVHRLDRDTSGVLVVAKTLAITHHLADQFKFHHAQKTYWTIVHGKPLPSFGVIDAPLLKKQLTNRDGERVYVDVDDGKEAKTHYRLIKAFNAFSLVEFKPLTGRTHQIRVHAAYMGCPIVGDGKYGENPLKKPLHLHARALRVTTTDNHPLTFTAHPSEHFLKTLATHRVKWEDFT